MAVYTRLTGDEICQFLDQYTLGILIDFHPIEEGIENTNYLIVTSSGRYILTLFENRVKEEDIPFYIALKQHLALKGIACPKPMKNKQGGLYSELAERPAVIVSFLNGKGVDRVEAYHLPALGEQLARMHIAASDFNMQRENDLSLFGWQKLYVKVKHGLNTIQPDLETFVTEEIAMLSRSWEFDIPQGIIHADLFPDNVFFLNHNLSGVIDFFISPVMIIGSMIWQFALMPGVLIHVLNLNGTGQLNLVKAYHQVRPLLKEELEALPVILRGAAIRFLLTRSYDYLNQIPGALVKVKDPKEYIAKLTFHRQHRVSEWLPIFAI